MHTVINTSFLYTGKFADEMKAINSSMVLHNKGSEIIRDFSNTSSLVHVTLGFCVIHNNQIQDIADGLGQLLETTKKRSLVQYLVIKENSLGIQPRMDYSPSDALQELHTKIMDFTEPFDVGIVDKKNFSEPVNDTTVERIKIYRSQSAYKNYYPHLTLGSGFPNHTEFSPKIELDTIIMSKVGNRCNCTEELYRFVLK